jgi:hypothetical protein
MKRLEYRIAMVTGGAAGITHDSSSKKIPVKII